VRERSFSAVNEIIASAHTTQAFQWRKLRNESRIQRVLIATA